jgi:hypothetical protein
MNRNMRGYLDRAAALGDDKTARAHGSLKTLMGKLFGEDLKMEGSGADYFFVTCSVHFPCDKESGRHRPGVPVESRIIIGVCVPRTFQIP